MYELHATWQWREDVSFATKPWRAIVYCAGKVAEAHNFKTEDAAKAFAQSYARDAKRVGLV